MDLWKTLKNWPLKIFWQKGHRWNFCWWLSLIDELDTWHIISRWWSIIFSSRFFWPSPIAWQEHPSAKHSEVFLFLFAGMVLDGGWYIETHDLRLGDAVFPLRNLVWVERFLAPKFKCNGYKRVDVKFSEVRLNLSELTWPMSLVGISKFGSQYMMVSARKVMWNWMFGSQIKKINKRDHEYLHLKQYEQEIK